MLRFETALLDLAERGRERVWWTRVGSCWISAAVVGSAFWSTGGRRGGGRSTSHTDDATLGHDVCGRALETLSQAVGRVAIIVVARVALDKLTVGGALHRAKNARRGSISVERALFEMMAPAAGLVD
jgi:hypothetical protein